MSSGGGGADDVDGTRRTEHLRAHLERLQRQNDELAERLLEAEQLIALKARELEAARPEQPAEPAPAEPELASRVAELEHQLDELLSSKSWRATASLRAARRRLRDLTGSRGPPSAT